MKCNFRTVVILSLASLICGAISAAQEPTPYRLTLHDAIQKALQANLNVLVADTRVEEAEGTRMRRLSAALFPQGARAKLRQLPEPLPRRFRDFVAWRSRRGWAVFQLRFSLLCASRTSSIFRVIAD